MSLCFSFVTSAQYRTTRSCTCRRRRCPCTTRHCARAVSFTILASSMPHTSNTCSSAGSVSACSSSSRTPPRAHSELLLHQRNPYNREIPRFLAECASDCDDVHVAEVTHPERSADENETNKTPITCIFLNSFKPDKSFFLSCCCFVFFNSINMAEAG